MIKLSECVELAMASVSRPHLHIPFYLIHNPIAGATFRVGYMITGRNAYLEALWWCASIVASITLAWAMS